MTTKLRLKGINRYGKPRMGATSYTAGRIDLEEPELSIALEAVAVTAGTWLDSRDSRSGIVTIRQAPGSGSGGGALREDMENLGVRVMNAAIVAVKRHRDPSYLSPDEIAARAQAAYQYLVDRRSAVMDSILNPDLADAIATQDDAARDIRECDGALDMLNDLLDKLSLVEATS